jgi:hypothetical protein
VKSAIPSIPGSIEQNSDDARTLAAAANLLGDIGEALAAGGFKDVARQLYLAANDLGAPDEVGDEWWTGPFTPL